MTVSALKKWKIENPTKDARLAPYLKEVNLWHGYIKYLGLPQLNDLKDTPIQNLFVLPKISSTWISADRAAESWSDRYSVLDALSVSNFMIILGEPGGGKSTLLNWLAWRLAGGKYPKELGPLIPLPMVLRDLNLGSMKNWEDLLTSFLSHPMAAALASSKPFVDEVLSEGQALVLIDGIDEISDIEVRNRLRNAVYEGREKYPKVKWILTSRIVGYEELPFENETKSTSHKGIDASLPRQGANIANSGIKVSDGLFYVCPFDNAQINEFCNNWYSLRERSKTEAQSKASDLVKALQEDGSTLRLARTPNLLTMMALLHRVKARLPHGRTLLYEDIAHAYLHTIDDYRKLHVGENYSLQHKKRWLARVAWELQSRRSLSKGKGASSILASKEDLLRWFSEAMAESGISDSEKSAHEFLDYIAKRSGLLIPRSEHAFAFLHLSFQEYFCSIYVLDQFESSIFGSKGSLNHTDLRKWVPMPAWTEVIVFLFELGSLKASHWSGWLLEKGFGKGFKKTPSYKIVSKNRVIFDLLYKILSNPHAGLTAESRISGLDELISSYFKGHRFIELQWLDNICREYSLFYSEKAIREKFWVECYKVQPYWLEVREKDVGYVFDQGVWDKVTSLYTEASIKEELLLKSFPGLRTLYCLGESEIRNAAILNGWRSLRSLAVVELDVLRKVDVEFVQNLTELGVSCKLQDCYAPLPFRDIMEISVKGEILNFEFIGRRKLNHLTVLSSTIHGFEGLEKVSGIKELFLLSVSFKGVDSSGIPKNIKTVRADRALLAGFSTDIWDIQNPEKGASLAIRRKRK